MTATTAPGNAATMATTRPAPAVEVRGLRKAYGTHVVLDGIDLEVPAGSVFALLGPNGAGKSTAIHILSTLIPADAGEVRIGGYDIATEANAVRGLIGLTGQVSAVDGQFTGEENLRLMADLSHLPKNAGRRRVAELLERFDLVDAANKPAMTYSGGMRRRLDLAMTLVGEPRIIFLDEPTTGLDPRSRRVMWDIVRDLVTDGVTVLLTTQYLEEADRLASRIAMLDNGRIVAEGTPADLAAAQHSTEIRFTLPADADPTELPRVSGGVATRGRNVDISTDDPTHDLLALTRWAAGRGADLDGLTVARPSLEDIYLTLTSDTEEAA
jgi:ABC-2 type transport system ATP-binding protein